MRSATLIVFFFMLRSPKGTLRGVAIPWQGQRPETRKPIRTITG
jgi:hypothetical protein